METPWLCTVAAMGAPRDGVDAFLDRAGEPALLGVCARVEIDHAVLPRLELGAECEELLSIELELVDHLQHATDASGGERGGSAGAPPPA